MDSIYQAALVRRWPSGEASKPRFGHDENLLTFASALEASVNLAPAARLARANWSAGAL